MPPKSAIFLSFLVDKMEITWRNELWPPTRPEVRSSTVSHLYFHIMSKTLHNFRNISPRVLAGNLEAALVSQPYGSIPWMLLMTSALKLPILMGKSTENFPGEPDCFHKFSTLWFLLSLCSYKLCIKCCGTLFISSSAKEGTLDPSIIGSHSFGNPKNG